MKLMDIDADESSFSFRDLQDLDVWDTFAPAFGSLTVVGATSYSGRLRIVGRQCFLQVQFSAVTSIASVAGTDYLTSPIGMQGLAGAAVMTNTTTNVAVGVCHVDVATSRIYLPAQAASGSVFNLAGWVEV